MTLAAIDLLVHHATILEMNVASYHGKGALDRKRGPAESRPTRRQGNSKTLMIDARIRS